MIAIFDTNIVIDCLGGFGEAADEVDRYTSRAISRITWIEVLVGVTDPGEEQQAEAFLRAFDVIEVTPAIARHAIAVRRERRLKLPDALIYATALHLDGNLVTRNTRDFPGTDPLVRVPYRR